MSSGPVSHPRPEEPSAVSAAAGVFIRNTGLLESALKSLPASGRPSYYPKLGEILERLLPPLYEAYDAYVAWVLKSEGRAIACKKECPACCSHFVSSVEPFELLAIHLRIRGREDYPDLLFAAHRRTALHERLLGEEGEAPEAADRALHRYFLRGVPCPFLEASGACGIYEARPMACRMFFSESSPRFCAGKGIVSPWNRNFQVELPDEAEEALARCSEQLEKLRLPDTLFAGVLAVNALFGRFDGAPSPA